MAKKYLTLVETYLSRFQRGGFLIGDVFKFNDNKCVHYLRNNYTLPFGGDGVFNLTEYENYSQTIVNQQDYRLVYHIDQKDIERALDCL